MKKEFEKEFETLMMKQHEIPNDVKERLTNTYEMIQVQSKRRKKKSTWVRITAAACTLLLAGGLLVNEQVRAGISDFLGIQDKGIEKALVEGFGVDNDSSATDQDVQVTLKQNFADANKIGLSFLLEFKDKTLLDSDTIEVSLGYRLINGDGEYILDLIPKDETQGNGGYISSFTPNPVIDIKRGIVQYDVVLESNHGNLPSLKDAVIEMEEIIVFLDYDFQKLTEELGPNFDVPMYKIVGEWDLTLINHPNDRPTPTFDYVIKEPSDDIEVISAIASPTSLNMQLVVDSEAFGPEGQFMWIADEAGIEYASEGYHLKENGGKTTVDVNFPISSYHNADSLTLIIDYLGEVELLKE